jgi:hypothetical protein
MSSSGIGRCVDPGLTDVSDAGSQLADFSILKMEAIRSSETSVNPGSKQRFIAEDDILQGTNILA